MNRKVAVMCAAVAFIFIEVFAVVSPARSECKTQGALALAMAQLLGKADDRTTPQAAAEVLQGLGIEPIAGWKLDACITEEVVLQLDTDVKKAIAAGTLTVDRGSLVAGALQSIGSVELGGILDRSHPEKAFSDGVSGEQGQKGTASPFRPE